MKLKQRELQKMPYNGPPPFKLSLDKDKIEDFGELEDLDYMYHARSEFTMSWRDHDFMQDEPTGKSSKAPAIFLGVLCVMAFIVLAVALLALPSIAERVHAQPTVKNRWEIVAEVAQATCAERGMVFQGTSINEWHDVYRVFCAKQNSAEVTEIFIHVVTE